MSRLANCAPAKKNGIVASTSVPARASPAPTRRRTSPCNASAARNAASSGASRAAAALTPNSCIDAAVIQ